MTTAKVYLSPMGNYKPLDFFFSKTAFRFELLKMNYIEIEIIYLKILLATHLDQPFLRKKFQKFVITQGH